MILQVVALSNEKHIDNVPYTTEMSPELGLD